MTRSRAQVCGLAFGVLALAGAVAALARDGVTAAAGTPGPAVSQSFALSVAPSVDRTSPPLRLQAGPAARATATGSAARLPLPAGGNVNGIQWEQAGGQFSKAEIEATVEYNAVCQWLRAARDGHDRDTALSVLDYAPRWPAFRDRATGQLLAEVVVEARRGAGSLLAGLLADCDSSHEREVVYATSLGLTPSS